MSHDSRPEPRASRAGSEGKDLTRHDAELPRTLAEALGQGGRDAGELAALAAGESAPADRRVALLARWVLRLARRLDALEARSRAHDGALGEQQESLRMICDLLKDLDDPYGFGLSLDERIADEGMGWAAGDAEG